MIGSDGSCQKGASRSVTRISSLKDAGVVEWSLGPRLRLEVVEWDRCGLDLALVVESFEDHRRLALGDLCQHRPKTDPFATVEN